MEWPALGRVSLLKLGIVEFIDSGHFIPGHPKCGAPHGHTYKVEVVIEGNHDGTMVIDFADLKSTVRKVLLEYDHKVFNDFIEYPSVENICLLFQKRLDENLEFPFTVRVWEGEGKWAEV